MSSKEQSRDPVWHSLIAIWHGELIETAKPIRSAPLNAFGLLLQRYILYCEDLQTCTAVSTWPLVSCIDSSFLPRVHAISSDHDPHTQWRS